jgi:hypothetical protein
MLARFFIRPSGQAGTITTSIVEAKKVSKRYFEQDLEVRGIAAELATEAARGRDSGFPGVNVFCWGPRQLSLGF